MLEAALPYFLFVLSIYIAQMLIYRLAKWPLTRRNIIWSIITGVSLVTIFRLVSHVPLDIRIASVVGGVFFIMVFGAVYLQEGLAFEDNRQLLVVNCLLSVVLGGFLGIVLSTWALQGYYKILYASLY